jgi:Tfp pilus assembly protein PilN
MNPFEMVVMIVAIVTIGKVLSGRIQGKRSRMQALAGDIQDDSQAVAEAARLRNEVNRLNERIQVLERLATDPAKRLSDEIDSLKNQ